jgi:hypothetical protein
VADAKPVKRPIYKLSTAELKEVKTKFDDLLEKGFIRPSNSPWGSSILFVPKEDGGLRMCVDYRALNKATIRNNCPLPRIDEVWGQIGRSHFFSSLDLRSGYNQIRIASEETQARFKPSMGSRMARYRWEFFIKFQVFNAAWQFALSIFYSIHMGLGQSYFQVNRRIWTNACHTVAKHPLSFTYSRNSLSTSTFGFCHGITRAGNKSVSPPSAAAESIPSPQFLTQLTAMYLRVPLLDAASSFVSPDHFLRLRCHHHFLCNKSRSKLSRRATSAAVFHLIDAPSI